MMSDKSKRNPCKNNFAWQYELDENIRNSNIHFIELVRLRASILDSINELRMMDDTRRRTDGKVSGINVLGV